MIGPVSLTTDYRLVFSDDPALTLAPRPAPPDAAPDDTDESYAAKLTAWAEARDAVVASNRALHDRAMETGDWAAITRPGETPTVFHVRNVPGAQWAAFERLVKIEPLGDRERSSLAFRLAVIGIDNADGIPLMKTEHTDRQGRRSGLGEILTAATTDALDRVTKVIVMELGALVQRQRGGPLGK